MLFESGSHVFKFEAKQVSKMVPVFGFRCGVTQYSMNCGLRRSRANVQVFATKYWPIAVTSAACSVLQIGIYP
jgi:hypothetical protein